MQLISEKLFNQHLSKMQCRERERERETERQRAKAALKLKNVKNSGGNHGLIFNNLLGNFRPHFEMH